MKRCVLVAAGLVAFTATPQAAPQSPAAGRDGSGGRTAALEALVPESPESYFLLAETVADGAQSPGAWRLAAQLFALSGALDPERFGRSGALGVADVTDARSAGGERCRSAAQALAHSKGARVARAAAVAAAEVTLVAAAAAVADVRAGRMSSAALRLRDPAVEDAFEHLVAQTAGGATRWRQDIAAGDRAGAPRLDADEVESVLVATAAALDPVDASWSWALVRTDQAPLIAVDERTLAAMLDVSPDRPLWRDGQWVAVPEPAAATDN